MTEGFGVAAAFEEAGDVNDNTPVILLDELRPKFKAQAGIEFASQHLLDNQEIARLLMQLMNTPQEALETLQETIGHRFPAGDRYSQDRFAQTPYPFAENPVIDLAIFFRAYTNEARELFLWVADMDNEPTDPDLLDFYAKNLLLNKRTTRPSDHVYRALALEVPEALNRKRTQEQRAREILQSESYTVKNPEGHSLALIQ